MDFKPLRFSIPLLAMALNLSDASEAEAKAVSKSHITKPTAKKSASKSSDHKKAAAPKSKSTPSKEQTKSKPIPKPECKSIDIKNRVKVAYFVNMDTGEILHGIEDTDKRLFQASVTKTAFIYTALAMVREGKLDLNDYIDIKIPDFIDTQNRPDVNKDFPRVAKMMTVKSLILASRLRSWNIAAHNLARAIEKADGKGRNAAIIVKEYTSKLGMKATYDDSEARGTGFPNKHALKVQHTTPGDEIILLKALQDFPSDMKWMNATSATLQLKTKDGTKKTWPIKSKILSQDRKNPNFDNFSYIKTAYGCQTGHGEGGIKAIEGINVGFFLSGYKSAASRSSDRHRELANIEERITRGDIKKISPIVTAETVIEIDLKQGDKNDSKIPQPQETKESNSPVGMEG